MSRDTQKRFSEELKATIISAITSGKINPSWVEIAELVNMPESTVKTASKREWGIYKPLEFMGIPDSPKIGLTDEIDQNVRELTGVGSRITTLDDLLLRCRVDLKTWEVKDYVVNKWEYGVKDGTVYPLFQVKAWLIRKRLNPIMPIISPVELPAVRIQKPAKPKNGEIRRALIIPDLHIGFARRIHTQELTPFHDRRVLDICLQLIKKNRYNKIIFIGDILDLAEWSSKFNPEPEYFFTTQPALLESAFWFQQMREAAPAATMEIYEGNHDKRLADLTALYLKSAYGLRPVDELDLPPTMTIERLLALHKLRIDYVNGYPDNGRWLNNNVMIRHGDVVRNGPGDTAKAIINKTTYTTIFGHIHRRELISRRIATRAGDVIHSAFCPGCACHIDGRVPGSSSEQQWQQGIAEIQYMDNMESIIPIPIENGAAIYENQLFIGVDNSLKLDTMLNKTLESMK